MKKKVHFSDDITASDGLNSLKISQLCEEDKAKIANLIRKLVHLGKENKKLKEDLEAERQEKEEKIEKIQVLERQREEESANAKVKRQVLEQQISEFQEKWKNIRFHTAVPWLFPLFPCLFP